MTKYNTTTQQSEGANLRHGGVIFSLGEFIKGEETYGTPLLVTAATYINFTEGIVFNGEHIVS